MERIIVLLILSLGLTISCSRSVDTDAVLSFKFNKANEGPQANSVIAGYYPDLILVNIKYDGKTHFQQWECPYSHGSSSGDISSCVLPSSVAMNKGIPAGANRLVQVLLVYSNEQGSMQFFYSDKTVSFNGGSANVTVGGAGWTINTSGKEGRVAGRLRRGTTNATDLTGTAIGYYQPSNGNPAMEVVKSPVFAGWFDFMFLEDVHFTYKMQGTNEVLISNKKLQDFDKTPAQITAGNLKMIKVHVPAHYEVWAEEQNKLINASDIMAMDYVNGNGSFTGTSLISTLLDGSSLTVSSVATADDILRINFNKLINLTSFDLYYDNSLGGPRTLAMYGQDYSSASISYTPDLSIASGAQTSVNKTIGTALNATSNLTIAHPFSPALDFEDIIIKYNNYSSEYSSQRDNYLMYFNITSNDVSTGATSGDGVGWQAPGAPLYFRDNQLLALGSDPVDTDGAWRYKATDLTGYPSGNNSIFTDVSITSSATNKVYIEKVSPSNGCSAISADCVPYLAQNENVRTAAPFDGPYVEPLDLSCTSNCVFNNANSFSYVPGVTDMRTILFKVPKSYEIDHDEIDCSVLETAGYALEDLGTSLSMTAVPAANLTNSRVIMCPYQLIPTGKKYFGFGKELEY